MADEIIRWTAWLAMAALAASVAIRVCRTPGHTIHDEAARGFWTAGCALLWMHVGLAFQFRHHWSHGEAYAHTARQTAEFTGFDWGGGLYFNYVLMLVWGGDALWWWLAPDSYRDRPRVVSLAINGFLAFMAFNATVVFGSGLLRWLAAMATLILGFLALRRRAGGASP